MDALANVVNAAVFLYRRHQLMHRNSESCDVLVQRVRFVESIASSLAKNEGLLRESATLPQTLTRLCNAIQAATSLIDEIGNLGPLDRAWNAGRLQRALEACNQQLTEVQVELSVPLQTAVAEQLDKKLSRLEDAMRREYSRSTFLTHTGGVLENERLALTENEKVSLPNNVVFERIHALNETKFAFLPFFLDQEIVPLEDRRFEEHFSPVGLRHGLGGNQFCEFEGIAAAWRYALEKNQRRVLVEAPAGSGKSTMVRWLARHPEALCATATAAAAEGTAVPQVLRHGCDASEEGSCDFGESEDNHQHAGSSDVVAADNQDDSTSPRRRRLTTEDSGNTDCAPDSNSDDSFVAAVLMIDLVRLERDLIDNASAHDDKADSAFPITLTDLLQSSCFHSAGGRPLFSRYEVDSAVRTLEAAAVRVMYVFDGYDEVQSTSCRPLRRLLLGLHLLDTNRDDEEAVSLRQFARNVMVTTRPERRGSFSYLKTRDTEVPEFDQYCHMRLLPWSSETCDKYVERFPALTTANKESALQLLRSDCFNLMERLPFTCHVLCCAVLINQVSDERRSLCYPSQVLEAVVDTTLNKKRMESGVHSAQDLHLVRNDLELLAYQAACAERTTLRLTADSMRAVAASGLVELVSRPAHVRFIHKTVMEYLAACYMFRQWSGAHGATTTTAAAVGCDDAAGTILPLHQAVTWQFVAELARLAAEHLVAESIGKKKPTPQQPSSQHPLRHIDAMVLHVADRFVKEMMPIISAADQDQVESSHEYRRVMAERCAIPSIVNFCLTIAVRPPVNQRHSSDVDGTRHVFKLLMDKLPGSTTSRVAQLLPAAARRAVSHTWTILFVEPAAYAGALYVLNRLCDHCGHVTWMKHAALEAATSRRGQQTLDFLVRRLGVRLSVEEAALTYHTEAMRVILDEIAAAFVESGDGAMEGELLRSRISHLEPVGGWYFLVRRIQRMTQSACNAVFREEARRKEDVSPPPLPAPVGLLRQLVCFLSDHEQCRDTWQRLIMSPNVFANIICAASDARGDGFVHKYRRVVSLAELILPHTFRYLLSHAFHESTPASQLSPKSSLNVSEAIADLPRRARCFPAATTLEWNQVSLPTCSVREVVNSLDGSKCFGSITHVALTVATTTCYDDVAVWCASADCMFPSLQTWSLTVVDAECATGCGGEGASPRVSPTVRNDLGDFTQHRVVSKLRETVWPQSSNNARLDVNSEASERRLACQLAHVSRSGFLFLRDVRYWSDKPGVASAETRFQRVDRLLSVDVARSAVRCAPVAANDGAIRWILSPNPVVDTRDDVVDGGFLTMELPVTACSFVTYVDLSGVAPSLLTKQHLGELLCRSKSLTVLRIEALDEGNNPDHHVDPLAFEELPAERTCYGSVCDALATVPATADGPMLRVLSVDTRLVFGGQCRVLLRAQHLDTLSLVMRHDIPQFSRRLAELTSSCGAGALRRLHVRVLPLMPRTRGAVPEELTMARLSLQLPQFAKLQELALHAVSLTTTSVAFTLPGLTHLERIWLSDTPGVSHAKLLIVLHALRQLQFLSIRGTEVTAVESALHLIATASRDAGPTTTSVLSQVRFCPPSKGARRQDDGDTGGPLRSSSTSSESVDSHEVLAPSSCCQCQRIPELGRQLAQVGVELQTHGPFWPALISLTDKVPA